MLTGNLLDDIVVSGRSKDQRMWIELLQINIFTYPTLTEFRNVIIQRIIDFVDVKYRIIFDAV